MAHSAFIARFSSLENFREVPKNEAVKYIGQLVDTWNGMIAAGDGPTGMGFALFTYYLAAYDSGLMRLTDKFDKEMSPLSRMGESLSHNNPS